MKVLIRAMQAPTSRIEASRGILRAVPLPARPQGMHPESTPEVVGRLHLLKRGKGSQCLPGPRTLYREEFLGGGEADHHNC